MKTRKQSVAQSKPMWEGIYSSGDLLVAKLGKIFCAWRAARELGEGEPRSEALRDLAIKLEEEIENLSPMSLEFAAAKIIIALRGTIYLKFISPDRNERLLAQAAVASLQSFGLEELYDHCFPDDDFPEDGQGFIASKL